MRKEKVKVLVSQLVSLFSIPWTVVHQAPLFMEFSRQEFWSGLSCLTQHQDTPLLTANLKEEHHKFNYAPINFPPVSI